MGSIFTRNNIDDSNKIPDPLEEFRKSRSCCYRYNDFFRRRRIAEETARIEKEIRSIGFK